MNLAVVVLAAGQGSRMQSKLPKVLQPLAGKPLLEHILATVNLLKPVQTIVVVGVGGEEVKAKFHHHAHIQWVKQKEQLGTGHAVLQALETLKQNSVSKQVLIVYGDVPLIQVATLKDLIEKVSQSATESLGIVTHITTNPDGLGRILRDAAGNLLGSVEERDADEIQKAIQEINAGIYVVSKSLLEKWLPKLFPHNAQQEYYLTDILEMAVAANIKIESVLSPTEWEIQGVNDKAQLANLERRYQLNCAIQWMKRGVTIIDPNRFDIRGDNIKIGKDVSIDINVILEGPVTIGDGVKIGPNVIIKNSTIENDVEILANSFLEGVKIGERCAIGPFARLRPETILKNDAKVGNFVEIKKSEIGANTKVNHLSYIGDAILGSRVNIGAGTITCNYDGVNKYQTIIEDDCFIGSDTQLVAPVKVGKSVTVGAGTTITKDIPEHHLVHNKIVHRIVNLNDEREN